MVEVEVALQYNDSYVETIYTYVNSVNTREGGTHLEGFRSALTRAINNAAHRNNLLKNNDAQVRGGEDVREGLASVISTRVANPQFEGGQTKMRLGNSNVRGGIVDSLVYSSLTEYFEEHPKTLQVVVDKALTAARAREAAKTPASLPGGRARWNQQVFPGNLPTARSGTRQRANSTSWKEILQAVPQNRGGGTGSSRQSSPCGGARS